MTDPQEASDEVETAAKSAGEPVPIHHDDQQGPGVGGPASAIESTAESSLDEPDSVGEDGSPDGQSRNPL